VLHEDTQANAWSKYVSAQTVQTVELVHDLQLVLQAWHMLDVMFPK